MKEMRMVRKGVLLSFLVTLSVTLSSCGQEQTQSPAAVTDVSAGNEEQISAYVESEPEASAKADKDVRTDVLLREARPSMFRADRVLSEHPECKEPFAVALSKSIVDNPEISGYFITDDDGDGVPELLIYMGSPYQQNYQIYAISDKEAVLREERYLPADYEAEQQMEAENPNKEAYLMFGLDPEVDKSLYGYDIHELETTISSYITPATDDMGRKFCDGYYVISPVYITAIAPAYGNRIYAWSELAVNGYTLWRDFLIEDGPFIRIISGNGVFLFSRDDGNNLVLEAAEHSGMHANSSRSYDDIAMSESMVDGKAEAEWNHEYLHKQIRKDWIRGFSEENDLGARWYYEYLGDKAVALYDDLPDSYIGGTYHYVSDLGYELNYDMENLSLVPAGFYGESNLEFVDGKEHFSCLDHKDDDFEIVKFKERSIDEIYNKFVSNDNTIGDLRDSWETWAETPAKQEVAFGADGKTAIRIDGELEHYYEKSSSGEEFIDLSRVTCYLVEANDTVYAFYIRELQQRNEEMIPDHHQIYETVLNTVTFVQ